ncbi:Uncharacterised protein [uncultured archaeon]|nr:Uncharacterised protein [uncultured archaeon]
MKIKYCPSCGGIDIKALPTSRDQCMKCKFVGEMREGSMDEINQYAKSLKSGIQPQLPGQQAGPAGPGVGGAAQLKAKLNALKGKSTGDVEFL